MAQGLADRAAIAVENAQLYRDAERAIRAREDILAIVSHDLRNPLSAINMSAATLLNALVRKGPSDPRTQKQLEMILRNTGRMTRLIGDLLDMASIQAGRLAVELLAQEIAPIVAEAVEAAEPIARANGQTISCELAVGATHCSVDRERMLQLFANLLGNAEKFSPHGGKIVVRAKLKENEVECSVSDSGPGISEQDLPHIFDAYWSATHEAKRGTGLGLYISKGIVDAHGGRIWVESQAGFGATFRFTLPLVAS
jgi:signal transduction histidine kinase